MADVTRAIELIFGIKDETSAGLSTISDGIGDIDQRISAVAQPLANFTESLLKIEGAAALVGGALVGLAIKGAVDFQSSLIDLQKVLDPTDGNLQQFAGLAVEISNKYGESSTQVLQSAADFKQAGFTASEAFNLAEVSIQALKITELQGDEAARTFIKSLAGFELPASAAATILDVLNEVSNKFAVDSAQLAEALGKVAPIAHQTGFSIQEITAVMEPAIHAFQDGELVGTAFVTILQRLVSDNKNVTDALATLKVSQLDANNQLRSGKDILHDVQVAYQTLDPSLKLVTASNLAGVDQAAKAVLAFDNLKEVTGVLAVAMNASGSAAAELEVRMAAAKEQGQRVLAIFDNVRILFGGTLLDGFQSLQGSAINLGLVLQQMVQAGAFGGLSAEINLAQTTLAQFINTLAANLPTAFKQLDFTGLNTQIDELQAAVSGLFGGIDLTTPEGLRDALQSIVNLGTNLTAFTQGVVLGFGAVKDAAGFLTSALGGTHESAAKTFGEIGAFAITYTAVSPLVRLLGDAFNLLPVGIGAARLAVLVLNSAFASSPLGIAAIVASVTVAGLATTDFGKGLLATAGQAIATGASFVSNLIPSFYGFASAAQAAVLPLGAVGTAAKLTEQGFGLLVNPALQAKNAVADLTDVNFTLVDSYESVTQAADPAAAAVAKVGQAAAQVAPVLKDGVFAFQDFAEGLEKSTGAFVLAQPSLASYLAQVRELGGVNRDTTLATDLQTQGFKAQLIPVTDLETGVVHYTEALTFSGQAGEDAGNKTALAMSKTFEETLKAEKEANDFNLAWEKIQSQERVAVFSLQADIAIAQIQAGTEQIKAAFESVNTTITSTGDTISNLVKTFADLEGHAGSQSVIADLLQQENQRRQEALDLQKQLVEAQVRYLNATIDRLSQGDALITVTADGLEPELEAFMFKILERVQIRASEQSQQFLLGLQ